MQFVFEADLPYQHDAINAVCDLFNGQPISQANFTVTSQMQTSSFAGYAAGVGIGNRLQLLTDELEANLRRVQQRNGLQIAANFSSADYTIEMETGTGKTYVYLRTIYELNKKYGFAKFIIVVPSVAIREGVIKTLQMTAGHFHTLYGRHAQYFTYDSRKPYQVRNFATSNEIQVMVVTVGAINKADKNNLYKTSEKIGDAEPIELIRETRPIVIVDEPQSVDGGLEGKGREALSKMAPLCTLRYSATHRDNYHMVYRLDAVDAFDKQLVKQIEVASMEIEGGFNRAYVKLISVSNARNTISAKVEIDKQMGSATTSKVARKVVTVKQGDDLGQIANRALYSGIIVQAIHSRAGSEAIELAGTGEETQLRLGQVVGEVDAGSLQRQMIRRTIEEHFDKELRLNPQGIKVLSLFFIDEVAQYRAYDDGVVKPGPLAVVFEEEFRRAALRAKYRPLFVDSNIDTLLADVHNGYFSIDKNQRWADTSEANNTGRENAERAYSLIMRDKEKLLSFDSKLKFIFSHSALREGWDNPNVFQICVLRDMNSLLTRRQTIGRGLRLCVRQSGERVRSREVNTLTVIASESYQLFAKQLQAELTNETGIEFGIVTSHQFTGLTSLDAAGDIIELSAEASAKLHQTFVDRGYIDEAGNTQVTLRADLRDGVLQLPTEFEPFREQIVTTLKKVAGRLEIKNAAERGTIRRRPQVLDGADFRALWDRIKAKTTYRVDFDNATLLANCIEALKAAPAVPATRVHIKKADISIDRSGVSATVTSQELPLVIDESGLHLPDILTELQDKTALTRKSLATILIQSGRLNDFKRNPQRFMAMAIDEIKRCKQRALVDGIRYQRLGDQDCYAQELFAADELTGYLKQMIPTQKTIYDHVIFDSVGVERPFAEELEKSAAVKVYAKLPDWFKVPTPLGTYNPDWAVLIEEQGRERLFFVVETKSSQVLADLRPREEMKTKCGKAHFAALAGTQAKEAVAHYVVARTLADVVAAKE